VGHVDSGKSTLSGRLLHLLGTISRKDMHKNEESKESMVLLCNISAASFLHEAVLAYLTVCVV
jgi:sulfate adenylyltransferase subunit 1 (EFTu-like GTPase family)